MIHIGLMEKDNMIRMDFQVSYGGNDHKSELLMRQLDKMFEEAEKYPKKNSSLEISSNGYDPEFFTAHLKSSKYDDFRPLINYLKKYNFKELDDLWGDKKNTAIEIERDLKDLFNKKEMKR